MARKSFLKQLIDRYVTDFHQTTAGDVDEENTVDESDKSSCDWKNEISSNADLIKEEFQKLVTSEESSLDLCLLGSILVKHASDEFSSWFLCKCIDFIQQQKLKPIAIDSLISVVGFASRKTLANLFDKLQALIETRPDEHSWFRCLELLPIIIPLLENHAQSAGVDDILGDDVQEDYRSLIKDILIPVNYKTPICIPILAILGELNLQSDELDGILEKAMDAADNIPANDLPSFCYYALLASRRSGSCASFFNDILITLSNFEERHRGDASIRPVLGTVLMHLTLAVRQDAGLLKEVLRLAKQPPLRLLHSVFFVSFLLALAASPPYNDNIHPCLRNHVLRHLKLVDRATHAFWLSRLQDSVGGMLPITEVIATATKTCYSESVAESAVLFAFYMLDALTGVTMLNAVAASACGHAVSLTIQAFQSSESTQETVLGLLFERLLASGGAPNNVRGRFLLDIVRQLVVKGPHFLMGHSAKLRQLIDYLPSLPVATAEDLIKTLMLLFRVNVSLRDALLLLLRKLLFSRKIEHRLLAAKGYLQFLLNFKVVGGLSSTQPSQQPSGSNFFSASQFQTVREAGHKAGERVVNPANRSGNDALCFEILGILKRCLEQQEEVRKTVYHGLPEVLHRNSQLVDPVLHLLSNHLRYYTVDFDKRNRTVAGGSQEDDNDGDGNTTVNPDGDLPILFSSCLKKGPFRDEVAEPIADLFCCINRCLAEADRIEADERPEICSVLSRRLGRLVHGVLFGNVHQLLPNKEDPEADAPRCQLVVCTLAALLEVSYSAPLDDDDDDDHGDRTLNLTGVLPTTQPLDSRARRTLRMLSIFSRMLRISDAIPLPGGAGLGKKKTVAKKKPDGGGKKKAAGAYGGNNRIVALEALLVKHSPTRFLDLGFVERFIGDVLNAADSSSTGVERLTRSERDHDHLINLMAFLLHAGAKCHFADNRRLTESMYKLSRSCFRVVIDSDKQLALLPDDLKTFNCSALDFLLSVFSQLTSLRKSPMMNTPQMTQQRGSSMKTATIRDLLLELDLGEGVDGENGLKLKFIGKCFALIRSFSNEAAENNNPTKDVISRQIVVIINILKNFDHVGDNNDSPADAVTSEMAQLCRDVELTRATAARATFDFLLEASYRSSRKYRSLLSELAEDVLAKVGQAPCDQDSAPVDPAPARGAFAGLSANNAVGCAVVPLLHHVETQLADANFSLELVRLWLLAQDENPNASLNPANPGQTLARVRDVFFRQIFEHQYAIVKTMKAILDCDLTTQQVLLQALKTLTRLYESMWRSSRIVQSSLAALARAKPVGWLPTGFDQLVRLTGSDFQSSIYQAMTRFQEMSKEAARKKAKKGGGKNKRRTDEDDADEDGNDGNDEAETEPRPAVRSVGGGALEARLLPSLIFAIEQYEQMILRLSKRKGLHNLGANMKRSTVRDFRIVRVGNNDQQRRHNSHAIPPAPTSAARRRPLASRQASGEAGQEDETREHGNTPVPTGTVSKRRKLLQSQPMPTT